ncbi:MAG: tetratricopeptide repeat protein, partial [Gemmatimonadota bacterium]|nr:tetratricopeptide repeat protein [Gemmatimonadota bacterium]
GQSAPVQTAARTPAPPAASPVPAARPSSGGGTAAGMNREGEGLFERGNNAAAVERFRRAVQMAPANAYYRNNLGWALFQAGQVEAAARELEEVVRINPRRDIAHANLGEVRHAQGDIPGAIAAYERFLELNTDPRRERIAREKLRRLRGE